MRAVKNHISENFGPLLTCLVGHQQQSMSILCQMGRTSNECVVTCIGQISSLFVQVISIGTEILHHVPIVWYYIWQVLRLLLGYESSILQGRTSALQAHQTTFKTLQKDLQNFLTHLRLTKLVFVQRFVGDNNQANMYISNHQTSSTFRAFRMTYSNSTRFRVFKGLYEPWCVWSISTSLSDRLLQ